MNKKIKVEHKEPYHLNSNISVEYELLFGKETIIPGTKIKFKGTTGVFLFRYVVHNSQLNTTWIDCMDNKSGAFRAFYKDKLNKVVKEKKLKYVR